MSINTEITELNSSRLLEELPKKLEQLFFQKEMHEKIKELANRLFNRDNNEKEALPEILIRDVAWRFVLTQLDASFLDKEDFQKEGGHEFTQKIWNIKCLNRNIRRVYERCFNTIHKHTEDIFYQEASPFLKQKDPVLEDAID